MVILLASVGVVASSLVPVILIDLGGSLAQVGTVGNIVAPLIGLGASVLAGFAFRDVSRRVAWVAACLMGAIAGAALIPLSLGSYSFWHTSAMDKSAARPVQAATSYTVQSSLSNIGGIGLGSMAPLLADALGYPIVMAIGAGLGVLAAFAVLPFKAL
jgi:hypothetical protein